MYINFDKGRSGQQQSSESIGSTTVVTAAGALSLAWSRGYLAPEISDGKYGAASDVYSYGVVSLHVIFCLVNARMLYILSRLCWRALVDS